MPEVPPGDPAALVASTREAFAAAYGRDAEVVGHAPGRVNLIGEHTDYNGGLCLPIALPHRTYAAAAARTDGRVRVASRQRPEPWEGALDDVGPGTVPGWAAYAVGVLWALREAGRDVTGADLMVDSTVPLGAGLSSSAAIECAVALAVTGLLGEDVSEELRRALVPRVHPRGDRDRRRADRWSRPDRLVARPARCGAAHRLHLGLQPSDRPRPRRSRRAGDGHRRLARADRRRLRRPARRLRGGGADPRRGLAACGRPRRPRPARRQAPGPAGAARGDRDPPRARGHRCDRGGRLARGRTPVRRVPSLAARRLRGLLRRARPRGRRPRSTTGRSAPG